ncbi:katanin-interacting protein-like isoform X2 [Biomphalaria glabrata]|uniref:Katanin-interacting protein-like isoform X2 n=1 Tax=Biomphalaria glabrata TaxID=6526 RepID=A0A9U8EEQ1_BIOGL|nr:katanin-interacting protein-like isoform X2 [Biomphalaria glabrata]KAI8766400.1 katanin-interacting protein isoform X3 [Biomphalaria glabrata]
MDHSKGRRKWTNGDQDFQMPLSIPVAKEEVPPQYEHYLHLLQERNRLFKKLRQKDRKEIELEKKEKGFTVYLNSSFSAGKDTRNKFDANRELQRRKTTNAADQVTRSKQTDSARQVLERRRHWNISSVEFTSADGQRHKIKPPEILTGHYQEDFEDDEFESKMSSLDLNDDDSGVNNSSSLTTPRKQKTSFLKRVVAAKKEESETENTVVIKMEDIKKLRESLQKNQTIRQSIAMDSDSDDDPVEKCFKNDSDGERISPIDEEIEELIYSDDDNYDNRKVNYGVMKPSKLFKPGDTLVLEFQPIQNKSKTSTNLTAARKKTESDISPSVSFPKSSQLSSFTSGQNSLTPRELSIKSDASKSNRPLSASRKSTETKIDPHDEAAAVVRALQEENKMVEKSKSRPLPQPKKSSSISALPTTSSSLDKDKLSIQNQSASSSDKSEPNIDCVIKKVLQMNPKQQRHLLNTLSHIDTEDHLVNSHCITSSWSSKGPVTERMEVTVEILSNWGHSSLVGLTELQFFDESKCLIPIKPSDVSVHGVKDNYNKIEVLFNGKSKTTKERNMWSCPFDGHPIEFSILLINPNPGKDFNLGSVKVWNWNNKINNLDIGARHICIHFKGKLLFDGEVDKGCGNQIFDYSKHIVFSVNQSEANKSLSKSGLSLDLSKSGGNSIFLSKNSPRLTSPASESPTKTDSYGLTPSGSHHAFRSISRSSQSSASSSGSTKASGPIDEKGDEGVIRSETRTLLRATVLPRRGSASSGFSSPEIEPPKKQDNVKMPEKSRGQTPKKSKRVAANLNGRSNDNDSNSKSNNDSSESKPPLPPTHKSDSSSSRSLERSSTLQTKMSPKSSRSEPHISPNLSSPPSNLAKIDKASDKRDSDLLDSIKNMNQSENKRKKAVPTWLKGADNVGDKAAALRHSGKGDKTKEDSDIQKELDEEFERFSQSGTNKDNKTQEEDDVLFPMKKVEKTRAKWRRKEADLEESWGSLSFFNKSHRGRVSIDMGDDELDEYLKPEAKSSEAVIPAAPPRIPLPVDSWSDDDSEFTIPELPSGKEMVINIKTTWGDHHYVGLTGIQVFSSQGEQVVITKISANPSDINILPEYSRDPRVVTNLIDNVNRTRDDVHMWLAPFTAGKDHTIYLTFSKPCKIALMRIWNYNKSRIHSFRGAKDVIITLDGATVFKGEIARACGGIEGGTEAFGDTILFTTDEAILEAVSKHDDAFEGETFSDADDEMPVQRPSTADADDDSRPFTRAAGLLNKETSKGSSPRPANSFVMNVGDVLVYRAKKLQLQFTATWGDYHYLGLTGLELVGSEGEALPITTDMITASPQDLRHLPGNEKDDRTLDKLIDGHNLTCQDSHMWLIPFNEGQSHTVTVSLSQPTLLTGVRVWNYNKSPEDTYRGAKIMHVFINDKMVSPPEGYLLRKGPGICYFDFAQEINFSNATYANSLSSLSNAISDQNFESALQMPRGFIFQFQLFNTWGDQYYIGLNGLEFYDAAFHKIELTQTNIAAYPDSVNVLDNVINDARTPDKLIDGFNDTNDGRHMWLAPILPSIINRIYVIFDQPTSVSMIKLWNYSKTVTRGVKDFALLVDDLLVYNGTLQAISGGAKGIVPNCSAPVPHHTLLFSDNKEVVQKEKHFIISNQSEDQDIQLMNDKKLISQGTNAFSNKPVNQALRPKTSVTKTSRR